MTFHRKAIVPGLLALLLCIVGFSGHRVYLILNGYSTARLSYNSISTEYVDHGEDTHSIDSSGAASISDLQGKSGTDSSPLKVDFEELRGNLNSEVIGWLWCQDTVIDYPVVQHSDNEYYLNYNVNGEQNASGAIFLESANFSDFRDTNNILHGHHMGDGTMFASLDYWQSKDYFEAHPVMFLNTPGGNYCVELFAGFTTAANSKAYQFEFSTPLDIQNWIEWVQDQSVIRSDFNPSVNDHFLTLSTCAYAYDDARTVLIGCLIPVL